MKKRILSKFEYYYIMINLVFLDISIVVFYIVLTGLIK